MMQTKLERKVSALERVKANPSRLTTHDVINQQALDELMLKLEECRDSIQARQESYVITNHMKPTAYVRVEEGNERNPFTFTGMLLPFEWTDTDERTNKVMHRLRNRSMIIGNKAHDWFVPFCKTLLEDGTSMRLRIRLDNLHGERLAFIVPAARTPEHAKAEWSTAQARYSSQLPARAYQYTPEQLSRTIYERFVRNHGGSVTHYLPDTLSAIAVDRTAKIYVLSNGERIEELCGSLKHHEVILDRDISLCVQARQLNSMAELERAMVNAVSVDELYKF